MDLPLQIKHILSSWSNVSRSYTTPFCQSTLLTRTVHSGWCRWWFFILPSIRQSLFQQVLLSVAKTNSIHQPLFFIFCHLQTLLLFFQFFHKSLNLLLQCLLLRRGLFQTLFGRRQIFQHRFETGLGASSTTRHQCLSRWRCYRNFITDNLFAKPRILIVKDKIDQTRDGAHEKLARCWSDVRLNTSRFLQESGSSCVSRWRQRKLYTQVHTIIPPNSTYLHNSDAFFSLGCNTKTHVVIFAFNRIFHDRTRSRDLNGNNQFGTRRHWYRSSDVHRLFSFVCFQRRTINLLQQGGR